MPECMLCDVCVSDQLATASRSDSELNCHGIALAVESRSSYLANYEVALFALSGANRSKAQAVGGLKRMGRQPAACYFYTISHYH